MRSCPSFEAALAQLEEDGNKSNLQVKFSADTVVAPPGVHLSSVDTKNTPTLSIATSLLKPHAGDKYLAVCLDLDAPFPSLSFLGPINHWIEMDLVATGSDAEGFTTFEAKEPSLMYYAGPGPPPPSAPHRYVFLVWEQPDGLNLETMRKTLNIGEAPGVAARMRWDQIAFETTLNLGQPLAVNYFVASSR